MPEQKKRFADRLKQFHGLLWWMYPRFLVLVFVCMYLGAPQQIRACEKM